MLLCSRILLLGIVRSSTLNFINVGLHAWAQVDEDASQPRWRQLFDAPSHTLPAPMDLAASFLRLITSNLGKEE